MLSLKSTRCGPRRGADAQVGGHARRHRGGKPQRQRVGEGGRDGTRRGRIGTGGDNDGDGNRDERTRFTAPRIDTTEQDLLPADC